MLLSAERSALVIVDVQERLMPAVVEPDRVLRNIDVLLKAAGELKVPVLVSEQYPKGLGPTVAPVRNALPPDSVVEKITFSSAGAPAFMDRLVGLGRKQIVLLGAETHVCVLQTALAVAAADFDVFLVADACSSRTEANIELAIARMRANGIEIVSTEMVVFEWMERAGTPSFKIISQLIK
ncbi:hydrolase [Azospirillum soli]|uniref:hydrolase n=1 Tax=Azospirillum soli TaxID=1304799 RepID=UPI001AE568E5|nr:hydrolase [Azospirillum soli]MBP2314460.1 nicotinamidase-related amidase [Azospirillum soli]